MAGRNAVADTKMTFNYMPMQLKKLAVAVVLAFAASIAFAVTMEDEVSAEGRSREWSDAINTALILALEQHDGVILSSSKRSRIAQSDISKSASDGEAIDNDRKYELKDEIEQSVLKWSEGRISGFDIKSDKFDPDSKMWHVVLNVRFPKYIVGRDPNNLRRLAVGDFKIDVDSWGWDGASQSSAKWRDRFLRKLTSYLTQTRKFTVLDRAFTADIDNELARLSASNASKSDVNRRNRKLGTDYLIVGSIEFFNVSAQESGWRLRDTGSPFAILSYRVLLAPTEQVKWAGEVTLAATDFPLSDVNKFILSTSDTAARRIAFAIMDNILPLEIVAKKDNGLLVIGEGGLSVKEGDMFAVCKLGNAVYDTRTGEFLDFTEERIGKVEIVAVTPKCSYAKVVEGHLADMNIGSRLRRIGANDSGETGSVTFANLSGKDKKLKKRMLKLCSLPPESSVAEWFRLSVNKGQIESQKLRQLVLRITSAALFSIQKSDVYREKVRRFIEDVSSFEEELLVKCPTCQGTKTVVKKCTTCAGRGGCNGCRNGVRFARVPGGSWHFSTGVRYEKCGVCNGSGRCKRCGGTKTVRWTCNSCRGRGKIFSSDAAAKAYQRYKDIISWVFR